MIFYVSFLYLFLISSKLSLVSCDGCANHIDSNDLDGWGGWMGDAWMDDELMSNEKNIYEKKKYKRKIGRRVDDEKMGEKYIVEDRINRAKTIFMNQVILKKKENDKKKPYQATKNRNKKLGQQLMLTRGLNGKNKESNQTHGLNPLYTERIIGRNKYVEKRANRDTKTDILDFMSINLHTRTITKIYAPLCRSNQFNPISSRSKRDIKPPTSNSTQLFSQKHPAKLPLQIQMGILAPNTSTHPFNLKLALIAIKLAMKKLKNTSRIFSIFIKQADTLCNPSEASIHAYNFYKKDKVHVLLGPVCEYSLAPVARFARYWNLAVMTPGGMSGKFGRDKTKADPEFPLLTRVGVTFDSVANFVSLIMKKFEWNNIFLMCDFEAGDEITPRLCHFAASDIVHRFHQDDIGYRIHQFKGVDLLENIENVMALKIGLNHASEMGMSVNVVCRVQWLK